MTYEVINENGVRLYEGLPFFIGSGTQISKDELPQVQSAVEARQRNVSMWYNRAQKGIEVETAIKSESSGAVQNINMMYAYNAYQKFLTQSLLSLKDTFRLSTNNYQVDVERPTTILKNYIENLTLENNLLADDAILYGCAAICVDVNLDTTSQLPQVLMNRVRSKFLIYDFEQPGSAIFTIRVTPELAFKYDFLSDYWRQTLYNKAIASAASVAHLRVFVGELVVNGKLDNYVVIIYKRSVIYAEKNRFLTYVKAVSLYDKNNDFSPIYTVMKASEITRDNYKMIFDYNNELVNPIRIFPWAVSSEVWAEAQRTRILRTTQPNRVDNLLPGELDVSGLTGIQQNLQQLAQQAAGLNDYTLGEATGSVRTFGEAMLLADSASGIMNIISNKLKQRLILPILQDILEVLKVATAEISDIFDESLYIDMDIIKDQQEANTLVSLISMPMFGSVIQAMDSVQSLQLLRWILEKLHISGTESIFNTLITNVINQQQQQIQQQQIQNSQIVQ